MYNKKGISEVITTVLIVLLSVIAVAILWGFLSPLITNSGQKAQSTEACFNLDVKPTACTYVNSSGNFTATAVVKRGADTGSLSGIKSVLYFADGTSVVSNQLTGTSLPGELATVSFVFPASAKVPASVTAAGSVSVGGSSTSCDESAKVTCTAA